MKNLLLTPRDMQINTIHLTSMKMAIIEKLIRMLVRMWVRSTYTLAGRVSESVWRLHRALNTAFV